MKRIAEVSWTYHEKAEVTELDHHFIIIIISCHRPHGSLAAVTLQSVLFLALVVHARKMIPVPSLDVVTHRCRCHRLILVTSTLPARRVFNVVLWPFYVPNVSQLSFYRT